MTLKRKAYNKLLTWKKESNGASLLKLSGAHGVGKSSLCEQFGRDEYKSVIIIDFENASDELRSIFENDSADLDMFFAQLSELYATELYRWESLVVFDEALMYPKTQRFIDQLVADGRHDYIATGSSLPHGQCWQLHNLQGQNAQRHNAQVQNEQGLALYSSTESVEMLPLDFEEFLWAMGDETTIPFVRLCFEKRKPLGEALHRKIMDDFRQYLLVGGMPQAVAGYMARKDLAVADRVKKQMLSSYREVIRRYAGISESNVNAVFDALPEQLARKEKKFKQSSHEGSADPHSYGDALMWLNDSLFVNLCLGADDPELGLVPRSSRSSRKAYMADTGLLVTHAFGNAVFSENGLYPAIIHGDLGVCENMLIENAVAQMLRCAGHRLFYYSRSDKNNRDNSMAIDFLITRNEKICPVEVKTSSYRTGSSIDKFRYRFPDILGDAYVLYTNDVRVKDGVVQLPLYMAMFL